MEEKNSVDDLDAVRKLVETLEPFSEEERKRIVRWASEKLNISSEQLSPMGKVEPEAAVQENPKAQNIKSFVESKDPKGDNQFATVVAYYYRFEAQESEKKESISKKDLEDATRLVNWNRIKRPDQTLVNATNAGLLDNISRGQYRINSVGENLVAMVLPGGAPVKRPSSKAKVKGRKNK